MSGWVEGFFGDGETTHHNNITTPPPSAEEAELIRLMTQLAQQQLTSANDLQPLQRQMLEMALADLRRQAERDRTRQPMLDEIDRLQLEGLRGEAERAKKLGPIQEELLQAQLRAMKGEVSPEQRAAIKEATRSAYGAGAADIDDSTREGLGLISDELSNARGLRLSDTPMLREATMLAESGVKQKAGLQRTLRANQMGALMQAPQVASGIGLAQQQLAANAQGFQAQLRQQAYQNRMSFAGQTMSGGLGLSSIGQGAGASALSSLSGVRSQNRYSEGVVWDPGQFLQGHGSLAPWRSDRRLKEGVVRIGTLKSGIPVYSFRYLDAEERWIGVMADEVLPVIPSAVSKDEDGYYWVDYSKLH